LHSPGHWIRPIEHAQKDEHQSEEEISGEPQHVELEQDQWEDAEVEKQEALQHRHIEQQGGQHHGAGQLRHGERQRAAQGPHDEAHGAHDLSGR
jgi:hypothetical protein